MGLATMRNIPKGFQFRNQKPNINLPLIHCPVSQKVKESLQNIQVSTSIQDGIKARTILGRFH